MATTTPPEARTATDPGALQRYLDGPNAAIRDKVRGWLAENPPRPDLPMEEHREQVLAWARELSSEGDTKIGFPEEFGGEGNIDKYVASFETLAFGDLSLLVKCGVQFGLFGGAILHLGCRKHHEKYLPDVMSLDLPGCFAMTESGHGSNVQSLRTTATYDQDADELVIHTPDEDARKDYIGNAARHGRMAAVFAQLIVGGEERGVHCVLVPIRDDDGGTLPGVRIEDCGQKLGLDGVDNGRLWFDQVRVPRDNLLNKYAEIRDDGSYHSSIENPTKRFFTMLGTLIMGRVSVGGAGVYATKVAQTIAVRRALVRRQFGPPDSDREATLMEYRTHQRRLLPDLATTYALHFTQDEVRGRLHAIFAQDSPPDREKRELETFAAALKATATWHATHTIQECREACGGAGYIRSNRFAALKADTDVFTTFEGDNTVLLQLAAKNLLTDFRDSFGELDPLGTAAFVGRQVVSTVAEKGMIREFLGRLGDDLVPGRDSEADLLERETQLELFRWREQHVVSGAARRLKGGIDGGRDPFDVLVDTQDHVIGCAKAYIERVVLECFGEAVERAPEDVKPLLGRVCDLYALSAIERDRAWFQEHGRLSSTRSKAVIKNVNQLCKELADDAGTLVAAFGVPDEILGDAVGAL
jgi:acyl-CoA oxidase